MEEFHLGVTVHGPGAEVLQVNAAALAMLGLTEDQLLGKTPFDLEWDVVREDGSPLPGPEHPVPVALRTGRPVRNLTVGVHRPRTQDRVWLLVSADPQRDAEGRIRRVVCSFSDITERKSAEDERKALERKLQESQRLESLGVLAGGVAHDFNNLLTGIIGYASLARQEANATGRDFLDRVLQSAQRAAELCAQMLAYSGRGRFVVTPLDLSRAVRDLSALAPDVGGECGRCRWSWPTACRRCWPTPPRCARCCSTWCSTPQRRWASAAARWRCGPARPRAAATTCAAATQATTCRRENTFLSRWPTPAAAWTPTRGGGCSSRSSRRSSWGAGWGWRRCWALCAVITARSR